MIDNRHKVTHYNQAMEDLSGIPADEIVGTRNQWQAFYSAARPILADFIVDRASEEVIAKYYEGKCQKSPVKQGAYEAEGFFPDIGDNGKWLFFTAAPLMENDGKVFGAVETLQDIPARKLAEEALIRSERHLRTLLDFAPYSIVVYDMQGFVTYLNPAFTETFGWTFDELEGKSIPYVPPGMERETGEMIKKLLKIFSF